MLVGGGEQGRVDQYEETIQRYEVRLEEGEEEVSTCLGVLMCRLSPLPSPLLSFPSCAGEGNYVCGRE